MLRGYSTPLSPRGEASLAPLPPWHYAGNVLAIEYWAEPAAVAAVLPPGLTPAFDPAYCVAHFVEWQYCTEDGQEYLDPVRSQYAEFILLVAAAYQGEPVMTCPYIYVTQDVSLMRGLIQGWPKKLGSIHTTRAFNLMSKAAPRQAAGNSFGGTLAVNDRRLAEGIVNLQEEASQAPGLGASKVLNLRYFPQLVAGLHQTPAVYELVQLKANNWVSSTVWKGAASLNYYPAVGEELYDLRPVKVGAGYRFECALTVDDLTIIHDFKQNRPEQNPNG